LSALKNPPAIWVGFFEDKKTSLNRDIIFNIFLGLSVKFILNRFPINIVDYDSRYSKIEFYWGLKPHNIVVDAIQHLPSNAKVLDLGCGEGKNSFFLAKNNFNVTAIDFSEEGIRKLNEFAKKEKLKIKADVSDVKSYLQNCEKFDAIFAMNVLQFIDEKNIFDVIKNIQSKTKPKGLNVIASFIAETTKQKKMVLSKGRYFFDEEELKKLYKYWKIIFYEEKLGDWETHGEPRHRHFTVKLIAQNK
jgi:tellurite methyltransferase